MNHSIVNCEALRDIDIVHKRSYVDFKVRLADHLLSDHGDRMVYANGVEARYPYLDQEGIELCNTDTATSKAFWV